MVSLSQKDLSKIEVLETKDAFYRGRFYLVQPKNYGHRSGIDAMLLASAVPNNFQGHVADLGAGAGAAGFAVAVRVPLAHVTLVEKSDFMFSYAQKTHKLPENAVYQDRVHLLQADICLKGAQRVAAGLHDMSYDFVIFNPPFNAACDQSSGDVEKDRAHRMSVTMFEDWLRTTAAILRANGHMALIARPMSLPQILEALGRRFGCVKIIPIHARPRLPALRIIVYAQLGRKTGLEILPPLFLHGEKGDQFSSEVDCLLNGQSGLFDHLLF